VLCETWGGNPLLNVARKWRATAEGEVEEQGEEIILSRRELETLARYFSDLRVEHISLLAMGKRMLRGRFERRWARGAVSALEKTDAAVLKLLPMLANYCGEAVITACR